MNVFVMSNLNLPWPISGCVGEEPHPHLNTTCYEVIVESSKIPPGPPFPATSLLEQKRRELRTGEEPWVAKKQPLVLLTFKHKICVTTTPHQHLQLPTSSGTHFQWLQSQVQALQQLLPAQPRAGNGVELGCVSCSAPQRATHIKTRSVLAGMQSST